MLVLELFLFAVSISTAQAVQGFNYGSVRDTGAIKYQPDFQAEFSAAKALLGTSGTFGSARLYTTIQAGTVNTPISAIPAAIAEGTTLLLGMWASAGQGNIDNEIAALKSAIAAYGTAFTSLVIGLSVGSEDLYRITPTGLANDPNSIGASPDTLVNYVRQVRTAVAGTALSNVPIGHVDTWTAWVNGSNNAVIAACDFIGMNTFPYYQTTDSNAIDSGAALFQNAYSATLGAAQGKPVWITETGWPVSGKTSNLAIASIPNAKRYWDEVGCTLFGKTTTYWYTLVDANTDPTQPKFGIVGTPLTSTPLFDLSCAAPPPPATAAAPTIAIPSTTAALVIPATPSQQALSTTPQAVSSTSPQAPALSSVGSSAISTQSISPNTPPTSSTPVTSSVISAASVSTSNKIPLSSLPTTSQPSAGASRSLFSSNTASSSTYLASTDILTTVVPVTSTRTTLTSTPGNSITGTSSPSPSVIGNAAEASTADLLGALGVVFCLTIAFL